jgi:hypothetical protein
MAPGRLDQTDDISGFSAAEQADGSIRRLTAHWAYKTITAADPKCPLDGGPSCRSPCNQPREPSQPSSSPGSMQAGSQQPAPHDGDDGVAAVTRAPRSIHDLGTGCTAAHGPISRRGGQCAPSSLPTRATAAPEPVPCLQVRIILH